MSEYSIKGETLTALADEVRRLAASERKMTPAEMITALSAVVIETVEEYDGSITIIEA